MKRILISVGARPNFIKVTQFKRVAAELGGIEVKLVHTGQHYDRFMSAVFFEQFNLRPDHYLVLNARSPQERFGEMISQLSKLMIETKPDLVLVPGDVDSTLAAALAANKTGTRLAHLEAGLRSFDPSMPEEVNRVLTDHLSEIFFATEKSAINNLVAASNSPENIHFVGNTMIDTLVAFEHEIEDSQILDKLKITPKNYVLMTLHRPENVDNREGLQFIVNLCAAVASECELVFPLHPRTKNRMESFGLLKKLEQIPGMHLTDPLGYFDFQYLIKNAKVIVTDSGGIQEESTFRQVPCLTMRPQIDRPVTVDVGTNQMVPPDIDVIMEHFNNPKEGTVPALWDGHATERVMEVLAKELK
jgi:UDP-N-acetylglucosamine 2-epimerase (non-hydrolysing)